jgi:hypothetical protein
MYGCLQSVFFEKAFSKLDLNCDKIIGFFCTSAPAFVFNLVNATSFGVRSCSQGDRMSWLIFTQDVAQPLFLSKLLHYLNCAKSSPTMRATSVIFNKQSRVNIRSLGEFSTCLVSLASSHVVGYRRTDACRSQEDSLSNCRVTIT